LINTFNKVARYKINTQKLVALLYTSNELMTNEARKIILLTIASKMPGINLTKNVKHLHNAMCKELKKKMTSFVHELE
jgi:hypothetical protein